MQLTSFIQEIPDFPKPGILYRDIAPLLKNPQARNHLIELFGPLIQQEQINHIAGIDSRGFIVGSLLAHAYGLAFSMIRKAGKLPGTTLKQAYDYEYASAELEIQQNAFTSTDRVLLVDDILATGGTMCAAIELLKQTQVQHICCGCIVEIQSLQGRAKLAPHTTFSALIYA